MKAINLESNNSAYLLSIDKNAIDKEVLVELIERIRLEYLVKKADFDEDIETLGEEIKENWWSKNKQRLLGDILNNEEDNH